VQPGERSDNKWLQYSTANRAQDQQAYDQGHFIHKTHFGFYVWPEEELVYAPNSAQPKLDRTEEEMPDIEQVIFRFFMNEENVNKLVEFLSLENKKGHDHFDAERFGMFKALFRNFGDSFLPSFRTHIETLVTDHRESHQRAASELLAAIIRGSKHWPYSKVEPLWSWVVPAIRQALTKVSPETQRDWGTCFATSSDSRDPNRLHWLMEVAMEEPIRSQGSFIDASRLYMLQGVVAQQRWRVGELLHRLLAFLKPFLNHPYHNVRSRLGAVLTNIFALDIVFEGKGNASRTSPDEREFVEEVFPGLACLQEDSQTVPGEERESALRLLQTLSKWVSSSIASNLGSVKPHMFKFLPLLLGYEWYDTDPQIARDCQTSLSCLSRTLCSSALLVPMMDVVKSSAKAVSWKTRVSTLDFLQAMIFNNFMLLCSAQLNHDILRQEIAKLVLDSLNDDQIEVRVKAAQVLGGLVHCQFLSPPQYPGIIATFQSTLVEHCKGSISRQHMAIRHGAVLGLCAFVTAFPHTVPGFLPSLLVYLGDLLHDKQPIPATIKKSLQSFKRTHQDNWTEHKEAFTEDQLIDLTNLLVSPSYYA
jgi:proteasome activator subunit 4